MRFLKPLILSICLLLPTKELEKATKQITFYTAKEAKCLTDNVYHEARGEPFLGQVLVAKVTINRGNDICKVVYAKKQFSWTAYKRPKIHEPQAYYKAHTAIHEALETNAKFNYFHAIYVYPRWAHKHEGFQVGNHIFYQILH